MIFLEPLSRKFLCGGWSELLAWDPSDDVLAD